jgi:hypothetical protein
MIKNKLKSYIVSSADWEYEVDEIDPESAAVSAVILAFKDQSHNTCLSTVIMVNKKECYINEEIIKANFFPVSKILKKLGMDFLANQFNEYNSSINEIKNLKKRSSY